MSRKLDVLGLFEIGTENRVRPRTVAAWYYRGHLPEPDAILACGPIWRRSTIEPFIDGEGRERFERAAA